MRSEVAFVLMVIILVAPVSATAASQGTIIVHSHAQGVIQGGYIIVEGNVYHQYPDGSFDPLVTRIGHCEIRVVNGDGSIERYEVIVPAQGSAHVTVQGAAAATPSVVTPIVSAGPTIEEPVVEPVPEPTPIHGDNSDGVKNDKPKNPKRNK